MTILKLLIFHLSLKFTKGRHVSFAAPTKLARSIPDMLDHARWVFGTETREQAMDVARRMTLEHVIGQVRCPLLVVHGDDYDNATHFGSLQEKLGDWLYYRILTGNRLLNFVRRRCGLRYWSLAEFLKRQSGAAERYIARFVQAGFEDARRRSLDGIVCGHIHRAALFEREGCVYANDGDWVESLTALAEDPDGTLRLLSHTGETLAVMPPRFRPASHRPELSRAA